MQNRSVDGRKRVMIVSHEAKFALRLADWLAAEGYEVVIAREAKDVRSLLEEVKPNAVVLDLALPVVSGMEVLRVIRASRPEVPVVTMADAALHNLALLSIKAGACGFLLKPFERQQMSRLVAAEIRGPRSGESAA